MGSVRPGMRGEGIVVKRYACEEYYNAVMATMEVINSFATRHGFRIWKVSILHRKLSCVFVHSRIYFGDYLTNI